MPLAPRTPENHRCPPVGGSPQRAPPPPDGREGPPPPPKLPRVPLPPQETPKLRLKGAQASPTDGAGLDTNLGSCKSENAPAL